MTRRFRRQMQKESAPNLAEINAHLKRMETIIKTQRQLIDRYEKIIQELTGKGGNVPSSDA